ncbi:MAG: hypothetical protein ACKN9V_01315, partial [Pseudomonadota bacterium]
MRLKKLLRVGVWCGLLSVVASADCVVDQGPFEDSYGYAQFPFYNSCNEDFTVNLCVKSYPQGSSEAVFNLYSGTNYGRSSLILSDGLWATFDEYKWVAGGSVDCPFYD